MSEVPVLITSAGRRVGLSETFRDSGRRLGLNVRILAGDLAPEFSAACSLADKSFRLPPVLDKGYSEVVIDICKREGVALVVPTLDPELLPLASARKAIESVGARVNVSSSEVVRIARDKLETARVLSAANIATPRSARAQEPIVGTDDLPFPLIAKPLDGSSSRGICVITCHRDLDALSEPNGYVVQELLSGPEFTINVFVDRAGALRAAVPHKRMEVRAGEVSKGRTERHAALTSLAEQLVAALPGAEGALCFQAFITERGAIPFEINARFGGGYPLTHASGARFTQWLLEETLGLPSTASDEWTAGLLMLRYDGEIFR